MDQDATNLGMEVGLGPGHIALDGDPVSPAKGAQPSNFRPVYAVAKHAPISAVAEHNFIFQPPPSVDHHYFGISSLDSITK